jgi:hypothetical protein
VRPSGNEGSSGDRRSRCRVQHAGGWHQSAAPGQSPVSISAGQAAAVKDLEIGRNERFGGIVLSGFAAAQLVAAVVLMGVGAQPCQRAAGPVFSNPPRATTRSVCRGRSGRVRLLFFGVPGVTLWVVGQLRLTRGAQGDGRRHRRVPRPRPRRRTGSLAPVAVLMRGRARWLGVVLAAEVVASPRPPRPVPARHPRPPGVPIHRGAGSRSSPRPTARSATHPPHGGFSRAPAIPTCRGCGGRPLGSADPHLLLIEGDRCQPFGSMRCRPGPRRSPRRLSPHDRLQPDRPRPTGRWVRGGVRPGSLLGIHAEGPLMIIAGPLWSSWRTWSTVGHAAAATCGPARPPARCSGPSGVGACLVPQRHVPSTPVTMRAKPPTVGESLERKLGPGWGRRDQALGLDCEDYPG